VKERGAEREGERVRGKSFTAQQKKKKEKKGRKGAAVVAPAGLGRGRWRRRGGGVGRGCGGAWPGRRHGSAPAQRVGEGVGKEGVEKRERREKREREERVRERLIFRGRRGEGFK